MRNLLLICSALLLSTVLSSQSAEQTPSSTAAEAAPGFFKRIEHHAAVAFPWGRFAGDFSLGFSMRYAAIYPIRHYLGLGLGIGAETFSFQPGHSFYPATLELRGYTSKKPISPYYQLSVGYGMATAGSSLLVRQAEGGPSVLTLIGLRFKGAKRLDYTLGLGFQYQTGQNEQTIFPGLFMWPPPPPRIEEQDISFRRLTLQGSLIF